MNIASLLEEQDEELKNSQKPFIKKQTSRLNAEKRSSSKTLNTAPDSPHSKAYEKSITMSQASPLQSSALPMQSSSPLQSSASPMQSSTPLQSSATPLEEDIKAGTSYGLTAVPEEMLQCSQATFGPKDESSSPDETKEQEEPEKKENTGISLPILRASEKNESNTLLPKTSGLSQLSPSNDKGSETNKFSDALSSHASLRSPRSPTVPEKLQAALTNMKTRPMIPLNLGGGSHTLSPDYSGNRTGIQSQNTFGSASGKYANQRRDKNTVGSASFSITSNVSFQRGSEFLSPAKFVHPSKSTEADSQVLVRACATGDVETVRKILNVGGRNLNINEKIENDSLGRSALHVASSQGQIEIVHELLQCGNIDINLKDYDGWTALHSASSNGQAEVVAMLLEKYQYIDVNAKDRLDWTALHVSASNGHANVVSILLNSEDIIINAKDELGGTALHEAAAQGNTTIVIQILSTKRANINARNRDGRTALHEAISYGHIDIIRLLLEQPNIDVNIKNNNGRAALHDASFFGIIDIFETLVRQPGIDANVQDNDGRSLLHDACLKGRIKVANRLLEHADVNIIAIDDTGRTCLHFASFAGHVEIVDRILTTMDRNIQNGIIRKDHVLTMVDKGGRSAMHLAASKGRADVVLRLLQEKANPNGLTHNKWNPLHLAASRGHTAVCTALLDEDDAGRIKLNLIDVDVDGYDAFLLAVSNGHLEIVKLLYNALETIERFPSPSVQQPRTKEGCTALHLAALQGHVAIVEYVLETEGITAKDSTDIHGRTALMLAINEGHQAIIDALMKSKHYKEEDEKRSDVDGWDLAFYAATAGSKDLLQLLLSRDYDLNTTDVDNCTILHYATSNGHIEIVRMLAEQYDIDMDSRDNHGCTCLHLAASNGQLEIMLLLLKHLNVNETDTNGCTPLHYAASCGQLAVVEYLLQTEGCDVNVIDDDGCSALHYAYQNKYQSCIRVLLSSEQVENVIKAKYVTDAYQPTGFWDDAEHIMYVEHLANMKVRPTDKDATIFQLSKQRGRRLSTAGGNQHRSRTTPRQDRSTAHTPEPMDAHRHWSLEIASSETLEEAREKIMAAKQREKEKFEDPQFGMFSPKDRESYLKGVVGGPNKYHDYEKYRSQHEGKFNLPASQHKTFDSRWKESQRPSAQSHGHGAKTKQ